MVVSLLSIWNLARQEALKKQEAHIAFVLLSFVIIDLQPTLCFNSDFAETVGDKKRLLSSLPLVKKQGRQGIIDIRKPDSKPIPLENSFFDRVKSALDSAFETLDYQRTSRTA